jgi:hypothetical protein
MAASSDGETSPAARMSVISSRAGSASAACTAARAATSAICSVFIDSILTDLSLSVKMALYPRLTPAQASDILFPHHASQAEAAQAHATPGGATAAAGPLPGHGPSH